MQFHQIDPARYQKLWQAQPSRLPDYHRNYHTETPEGDVLELDFNLPRRMVRITLTAAAEHGRQYTAVLKGGVVLQERELASKRTLDLTSRLRPFFSYFQLLPDDGVLHAIGGTYGLPLASAVPGFRRRARIFREPITYEFTLRDALRKYLAKRRERQERLRGNPWYIRFLDRLPTELTDLALGAGAYLAFTEGLLNLTQLAGILGFLGVFAGALDWVWRHRDPFLPKVSLLLAASALAVYAQIQYRMWAIFL